MGKNKWQVGERDREKATKRVENYQLTRKHQADYSLWEYGKGRDVVALGIEPNGGAVSSSACDLCLSDGIEVGSEEKSEG